MTTGTALASAPQRGEAGGVIIELTDRGTVISFHKAARRAFARIAGRSIRFSCVTLTANPVEGSSPDGGSSTTTLAAPKRRRPFSPTFFDTERRDLCSIVRRTSTRRVRGGTATFPAQPIAVVPFTDRGARYIAEATVAKGLDSVIEAATFSARRGRFPTFARLEQKRTNGLSIVPLARGDANPPSGKIGYFTDGSSATAVGTARTGRRLFLTRGQGASIATNVFDYLSDPAF